MLLSTLYVHVYTCTCDNVHVHVHVAACHSYTLVRIVYEAAQLRVDCAEHLPVPVNTVMTYCMVFVN